MARPDQMPDGIDLHTVVQTCAWYRKRVRKDEKGITHLLLACRVPLRHVQFTGRCLADRHGILQSMDRLTSSGSVGLTSVRMPTRT